MALEDTIANTIRNDELLIELEDLEACIELFKKDEDIQIQQHINLR